MKIIFKLILLLSLTFTELNAQKNNIKSKSDSILNNKLMEDLEQFEVIENQLIKEDFNKDGEMDYIGLVKNDSVGFSIIYAISKGAQFIIPNFSQMAGDGHFHPTINKGGTNKITISFYDDYCYSNLEVLFSSKINDFVLNNFDYTYDMKVKGRKPVESVNLTFKNGKYASNIIYYLSRTSFTRTHFGILRIKNIKEIKKLITTNPSGIEN